MLPLFERFRELQELFALSFIREHSTIVVDVHDFTLKHGILSFVIMKISVKAWTVDSWLFV